MKRNCSPFVRVSRQLPTKTLASFGFMSTQQVLSLASAKLLRFIPVPTTPMLDDSGFSRLATERNRDRSNRCAPIITQASMKLIQRRHLIWLPLCHQPWIRRGVDVESLRLVDLWISGDVWPELKPCASPLERYERTSAPTTSNNNNQYVKPAAYNMGSIVGISRFSLPVSVGAV